MGSGTLAVQMSSFGSTYAAAHYSPAVVGLIGSMGAVPRITLTLTGGYAGDRWGPGRVVGASAIGLVGAAVIIGCSVAMLGLSPTVLVSWVVCCGVYDALQRPSAAVFRQSLPLGGSTQRFAATRQVIVQLSASTAPALGGAIYEHFGWYTLIVIAAASTLAYGSYTYWASKDLRPVKKSQSRRGFAYKVAFRYAVRHRSVLYAVCQITTLSGTLLPLIAIAPAIAGKQLHWQVTTVGYVQAAYAIGVAVVALALISRSSSKQWSVQRFGLFSVLLAPIPVGLAFASQNATVMAVLLAVGGGAIGFFVVASASQLLRATSRHVLARVQAIATVAQATAYAAGAGVIGAALERFALVEVAAAAALACGLALGALAVYSWTKRNRSH